MVSFLEISLFGKDCRKISMFILAIWSFISWNIAFLYYNYNSVFVKCIAGSPWPSTWLLVENGMEGVLHLRIQTVMVFRCGDCWTLNWRWKNLWTAVMDLHSINFPTMRCSVNQHNTLRIVNNFKIFSKAYFSK